MSFTTTFFLEYYEVQFPNNCSLYLESTRTDLSLGKKVVSDNLEASRRGIWYFWWEGLVTPASAAILVFLKAPLVFLYSPLDRGNPESEVTWSTNCSYEYRRTYFFLCIGIFFLVSCAFSVLLPNRNQSSLVRKWQREPNQSGSSWLSLPPTLVVQQCTSWKAAAAATLSLSMYLMLAFKILKERGMHRLWLQNSCPRSVSFHGRPRRKSRADESCHRHCCGVFRVRKEISAWTY